MSFANGNLNRSEHLFHFSDSDRKDRGAVLQGGALPPMGICLQWLRTLSGTRSIQMAKGQAPLQV